MKKFRFTRTDFEVADAVMCVLKSGMQLEFLCGKYPSMEWYPEEQVTDGDYTHTISYGKLVCAAYDRRLSEGGKQHDIRLRMERIGADSNPQGLPWYVIEVWYRKDGGEILKERFSYSLWSPSTEPVKRLEQWDKEMPELPPPPVSFK